ncbi:hypothetical protein [Acidocella sp.]|uniref:hypothetical protein n=1 Tax=Acidocella sp. TaxID=50710 RepID=UPI00260AD0FE|nr:hypothetical protein [Acidocella sp.]
MKLLHPCLLALTLALTACNANGHRAQGDFNAAGDNLGQGHVSSGFNDIGKGFSDGANATGEAIVHTAHVVGTGLQQ